MQCTNCGTHNTGESRFCAGCGAALPTGAVRKPDQTGNWTGQWQQNRSAASRGGTYAGQYPAQNKYSRRERGGLSLALKVILIAGAAVLGLFAIVFFGLRFLGSAADRQLLEVIELTDLPPEDCLSPLYRLTAGTKAARDPYTFSYPIGDFKPENGEILIVGIGFEYVQDSEGNDTLLYLPLEAELRDGVASATFVPADYLDAKEEIRCSGLERRLTEGLCIGLYYTRTYEREGDNALPGKFRILTTRSDRQLGFVNEGIADAILTDLENAYQYYVDLGYCFSSRTRWPLDVKLKRMGETSGEYVPIKTLQYSTLSLNLTLFSCFEPEQDERSYHAGDRFPLIVHEMGHFMQHCYASITGNCTWTDEAASCYYEWKTGGDVQETLELGKETVFQSVYPQKDDQNSGYGRMPLFQYLEEYRKPGFIHSLYTGTTGGYGGNDDWCAAITALCGDPKSYASDYYHKLLTRELAGERGTYSLSARDIYRAIAEQWPDGPSLGLAAGLALPAEGESLNTVFSSGADSIVLGQYSFTVESTGAQFLALNVTGGMVPEGAELWVYGSGNCSVSAYCCQNYNAQVLPGNGTSVDLRSFAEDTARGCIYLIQMVALQDSGAFSDNNTYTLSVMLSTNELLDATPGINHDDPNNGPTETSPAPSGSIPSASPAMTSDLLADAMPESAGDRFDRFAEPVPNARSGSICTEPSMRIDAFNIIGGRLVRPEITNAQNETFTYINEGYCNAGETIGLQMIASARDREQDNIEYNILENQLTMKITFYDENGNLIGTPAEQQSPEDGKEHSIGDTISAVVPENAVSVTIQGSFVHFYGSYGDYHSASVGISVNFRVCQEEVQSSAVDTELIDTSGFGSEDADETEDCEQFWTSMNGYWMCYNAVGEVEYFQFARESDGRKALLVGTVETGRAEPSEAISVSRHSDTVYEVIYRYDGVDYYLYFDGSQLDSGVILYAANRPEGYRAFDFTGTTIEDAQAYYDAYYQ